MLAESVTCLNINSEDFLQYFIWSGLNEEFRNQLIPITTETRPSYKEIIDNFFIANERYVNALKFKPKPRCKTEQNY